MAKLKGSITITEVSDGYSLSLSSSSVAIPANHDGTSPVLTYANTLVTLNRGGTEQPFTITSIVPSDSGILYNSKKEGENGWRVSITVLPSSLSSGSLTISVKADDGYQAQAVFSFSVLKNLSDIKWIKEWDGTYSQLGENYVITPRLFAGNKNESGELTGVYMGNLSGLLGSGLPDSPTEKAGIFGYNQNQLVFRIDQSGAMIAGWDIKSDAISSADGKLTLKSDGAISSQDGNVVHWSLDKSGSASFANGKVTMNANGDASFEGTIKALSGKIANWTIGQDLLYTTQIGLDSVSKYLAIANVSSVPESDGEWDGNHLSWVKKYGGVAMFYDSESSYGFIGYKGATKVFSAGSENFLAGWSFDDNAIWIGSKNNTAAQYTSASGSLTLGTNGLRGFSWYIDKDGTASFVKGNVYFGASSGKIAGWNFDADSLYIGTKKNAADSYTAQAGSITIGSKGLRGNSWYIDNDGTASFVSGKAYFGIDTGKLAGWSFDADSFFIGTKKNVLSAYTEKSGDMTLGTYGIRSCKWYLNSDGSGSLGGGNITWSADGDISLSPSVSISWNNIKDAIGNKLTHIDENGIYTGTLTAEQVSGLELDFEMGTIGGWVIGENDIHSTNKDGTTVTLRSDGTIFCGDAWKLNPDGTGSLANGNLWWEEDGTLHADPMSFLVGEERVELYMRLFDIQYEVISEDNYNITQVIPKYPFYGIRSTSFVSVDLESNGSGYIGIGGAMLKWDPETQAVYVVGSDGSSPVGFYSSGWISAKGANDTQGEGGGGGGLSYSRLDSWEGYSDEEKGGWVLSAYLGYRLYKDINDLKSGVAMSYAVQGTGNAITDVTRDSSRWVFTKGKTFSELGHLHLLSDISDLHSSWDAVLKAQKPNWLTAVSLATISDLHANWDAILKVAPSAYVTRWPTAAEVGALTQSAADSRYAMKTVTISAGAGLAGGGNLSANRTLSLAAVGTAGTYTKVTVDAYGRVTAHASLSAADIPSLSISKINGLQAALDKKLEATAFTELFEKVTLADGTTAIRAKLGLYSDKWLSAKGANPNQGEGGGFAYTRLDTWEGYDSATMDGWVLSAKLGYSLYNDVKSLKAGAAVSFTIEGTGNAITDISKDGTQLVFTRGMTFALSSHQHLLSNISDLNSGWRTLLKAAPSAYVTRWPSFSEVTSKPTTLAGYGITDAATKSHTHSQYLTAHQAIYSLTLQGNGTTLGTYTPNSKALTINITPSSIGAATSSHTHSQYLTGITKSMVEAVLTGNITSHTHSQYLTSHQAIYALTVKAGSTSVLSFNPKGAAATLTLKAGTNISLSADATNHAVTINNTYSYTHPSATATTIAAATGRVLSAITVNSLGHVTSVAAKTLASADIPTLAISKISGLQSSLDSKLAKATFDDLFEKVTLSDGTVAIHAKYGFYSDGFVSGKGANPSAGEGGGTAYNRLDTWEGYTDELATWVLSAGLGHSLYNDVQSLKRGAAVSFTIQGSGNAITDVTKSGTSLTFTKGLAFLTSHQNIYALTIKGNGTAIDKYTPNSAAKTINITPANIGAATSGHTHTFASLTSKPTTLSGYGITDAPTKTGGGASGTWGISISGTAAKAKYLVEQEVTSGALSSLTTGGHLYYGGGGNGATDKPSGVDSFGLLTMRTATGYRGQILIQSVTSGSPCMYFRSQGTLGGGWHKLLDDTNFSSYAARVSHSHTIAQISDLHATWDAILKAAPTIYVTRWPSIGEVTGKQSLAIKLNGGGTEGTNLFTYNGTAAKTVNITAAAIGAAASSHSHSYLPLSGGTMNAGAQIKEATINCAWYQGRDRALIRSTQSGSGDSYYPLWSSKSLNGSWECGTFQSNALFISYITDTNYSNKNNSVSAQFKFGADGVLTSKTFAGNLAWSYITGKPTSFTPSSHTHTISQITDRASLFTAFTANGNNTRITIGGTTKDLTVPYAKNCDTLDGLHGSSFMACNGLNGISLTGGNGNTAGYRLVIQKTMTEWSINNLVFVVASRHNGQGILSVAFHITAESPSSYGYSIRYFGANFAMSAPFRAFYNTSTHVFRLYWHYKDYTSTAINVLRVEGFPSPSNGTWYEAMPSDNGTELTIEYNNADTIGGTSKGGLLTALSSSSGTNLSLTVGGTTKTVADLYATAAEKLLTARTINGTSFNGTANITTANWGTARNISIASSNGGGAGAATSVNGSANVTLKLPATITATLSGNASSATKLATARTLWGQSFNGTSNVSGSLSSVVDISMTGRVSTGKATNTYLAGNQGQALVNSTASAGAYVMLYRGCSTNGYFTHGTYQGKYLLQYTAKSTVTAGTNNVTKSATLLDESGNATFPGTINAVLFHSTTGVYSDGYVSAKGQSSSSDMRLKNVISSVNLSLEQIANAPSFTFSWKSGGGKDVGSSAQYWRDILPDAVKKCNGYLEMGYGNIALVCAISLGKSVLSHEERIKKLERENLSLRRELHILKSKQI